MLTWLSKNSIPSSLILASCCLVPNTAISISSVLFYKYDNISRIINSVRSIHNVIGITQVLSLSRLNGHVVPSTQGVCFQDSGSPNLMTVISNQMVFAIYKKFVDLSLPASCTKLFLFTIHSKFKFTTCLISPP